MTHSYSFCRKLSCLPPAPVFIPVDEASPAVVPPSVPSSPSPDTDIFQESAMFGQAGSERRRRDIVYGV